MRMPYEQAEFIDDPTVPQFFIEGLQDVIIRGSNCEIIPFSYRRTAGGVFIKQPSHTCVAPLSAIASMVALVSRKVGGHVIASGVDMATQTFRLNL